MQASITNYMPGDVLFYASANGDIADVAIRQWTGSSFVHVAVAVSAVQKVEALMHGVILSPIVGRDVAASWSYTQHASPLVGANLARALAWLHGQIGQVYGYGDIANALLWKYQHAVSLDIGEHFDCSGLASEFLMQAGGVDLRGNINPHVITPAMLAQILGVG